MFLGIAHDLARWARQEATDDVSKVTFSSVMFITSTALLARSVQSVLSDAALYKEDMTTVWSRPNPLRKVA